MDKKSVVSLDDRFVKALFERPQEAGILLRENLPEVIARCLSDEPPELVHGSFVDDELKEHFTDRLFKAKTIHGRTALFYILIDHKRRPERRTGRQLMRYMERALSQWERENPKWRLLPAIVPFILYNGSKKWQMAHEFLALVDMEEEWRPYLLNFPYTVMNLGKIPDKELSKEPRLRVWLLAAKYATRTDQQQEIKELLIETLVEVPDELYVIVLYIMETYKSYGEKDVREIIQRVRPGEVDAMMSQYAQEIIAKGKPEWILEGKKDGLLEGERKGKQEEAVNILLRLLMRRVGILPLWVHDKVKSAELDTLEMWTDRVLDAHSLEDVFGSNPSN